MANARTIARLERQIQRRAAHCLQFELADPRGAFVTVTRVELSPDVASGKIFYSVLGEESDRAKAQHMLVDAAGFIQRQIAGVLRLRSMPHLRWVFDESILEADRVERLIREARERDRAINPESEEPVVSEDEGAVSEESPRDSSDFE